MNSLFFSLKTYVFCTLSACILVNGCASTMEIEKVENNRFSSKKLGRDWIWVRGNPSKWRIDPSKKVLLITTEVGNLYRDENDQKNILLKRIKYGNFQIDTKVHIDPKVNYQQCGLIVYVDDDNYIKLVRLHYNGQQVELGSEHGGKYLQQFSMCANTDVYLRLVKVDNVYTGYFSFDGKSYSSVGSYENDLGNKLMAGITGSNSSRVKDQCIAKFEYFTVTYFKNSNKTGKDH